MTLRFLLLVFVLILSSSANLPAQSKSAFFELRVRPLLLSKCASCHGKKKQEGGLRLDRAGDLFRGGDSGVIVVRGKPEQSRLIHLVRGDDKNLVMPPNKRLSKQEIKVLIQWVKDGAIWPGHKAQPTVTAGKGPLFSAQQKAYWAFQPLRRPRIPRLQDEWVTTPVDAFILAKLKQQRLRPTLRANRRVLLRRLTFDLTGLPPTPDELRGYLHDDSPAAWSKVVERLLASPAYGERWGKHWLDVARFGESAAHDGNNGYLHAWRYRDYVIEAFNQDLPFDQFVVEQLAGDLLPKTGEAGIDFRRMVATGFLQVGPKPVVMRDKQQMLLDIADEQLTTTGIAFLGLTIGCARCHDHKFDPIPTADYYSLAGIFTSTHIMLDHAADSMWIEPMVRTPAGKMVRVMAVQDHRKTADLAVHLRGNYRTLGAWAPRRFLQIIAGENHKPLATSASGRLELARWIASSKHPLTARVLVNRVWQKHFGQGIVRSVDDFGVRGQPPTHPALLDWLATEFMRRGWSIKALHRLILNSSTYRQSSSGVLPRTIRVDPDNKLFGRMVRRRLSAEEVRDSILFVSQRLDRRMGGTLFTSGFNFNRPDVKLSVVDIRNPATYEPYQRPRRSVYLPVIRNQMHPMLALFDTANEHIPVSKRGESIVAPQALFLMNSAFARSAGSGISRWSSQLADPQRIAAIYRSVLGREPTALELRESVRYIRKYRASIGLPPRGNTDRTPSPVRPYNEVVRSTKGLLAYYRLNNLRTVDGVPVTANALGEEHSGLVVNGALFGVPGAVAANGSAKDTAIELNGRNQRIQVDNVSFLDRATKGISIEYWVKPAHIAQEYAVGLDDLKNGKRYWKSGIHTVSRNGKTQLTIYHEFFGAGGFRFRTTPEAIVTVGKWHHVVFNMGKGRRQLFVNGKLVDDFSMNATPGYGGAPLTLGARADGKEWFRGGLDEVAIYDRVLDKQTVRGHYLAGRNLPGEKLDPDLAVWQSFSQAILCTNEFMFVE